MIQSQQKGCFLPERSFAPKKQDKRKSSPNTKNKNFKKTKENQKPNNSKEPLTKSPISIVDQLVQFADQIRLKEEEWNEKSFEFQQEKESNFQEIFNLNDSALRKRLIAKQRFFRRCILEIFTQEDEEEKESMKFLNDKMQEISEIGNFVDEDLTSIMEKIKD